MGVLVLGAILGVVVDRIFTYVIEKRVFMKIQSGCGQSDKGDYFSNSIGAGNEY